MGAEIPYRVHVLRLVEDVVEVDAVTGDEAEQKAEQLPGVAKAVKSIPLPTWYRDEEDD